MLKLVFILWAFTYVKTLSDHCILCFQIRRSIYKLSDFLFAFKQAGSQQFKELYTSELTTLLRYYPAIKKQVSYPELTYDQSDKEIYKTSSTLLHILQMKQNEARHALLQSLNPLRSAKDLILLPVTVIKDLGFNPGKTLSLIIEIVALLIPKLFDLFSLEIKSLIIMLFEKFVQG